MNKFRAILFGIFIALASPALASSTEQWVAGNGVGLTWTTIVGSEITGTSLPGGDSVLSSVTITNGTALDIFADFSMSFASETWGTGSPYFEVFIYPLNEDGTTYGDNAWTTTAAAGQPNSNYTGCIIPVPTPGGSALTGAAVGMCRGVVLPPGTFKIVIYNGAVTNTASSGNTFMYRTYNRQQH